MFAGLSSDSRKAASAKEWAFFFATMAWPVALAAKRYARTTLRRAQEITSVVGDAELVMESARAHSCCSVARKNVHRRREDGSFSVVSGAQPPLKDSCYSVSTYNSLKLLAVPILAIPLLAVPVLAVPVLVNSNCHREC